MSEKAVLLDINPNSEKVNDLLSSCVLSSRDLAGLSGEQDILEFVQVGW